MNYDIIILGSGPGGYVAAIRASQLGFKTAVVEKESLGGVCLNWGCIPTKALLKSAQVFSYLKHADSYGITVQDVDKNFDNIIKRSRNVATDMSKGVQFLMKKNKIDVINGLGKVQKGHKVAVTDVSGNETIYNAKHIIIATGTRSRTLPNIFQDGEKIIGYREAMNLPKQPETMTIIGSGAIGMEFAYFYATLGTKVTVVEAQDSILPLEDSEVSKQLDRSLKKIGVKTISAAMVENIDKTAEGVAVTVKTKKDTEVISSDIALLAIGVKSNIEEIGLESVGIDIAKDKIQVDEYYQTNVPGYYAIGDVVSGPALAHVASAEGILCIEKIAGMDVTPINYDNIPSCIYTTPEVASVGLKEHEAKEKGYDVKVGKFPFSASGKAKASGNPEGFVKVIFDAKYGEWLGCHMVGAGVTEMIAEAVVARNLETTGHEILKTIHPHPTMSEAIMEAVAAAYGEVIHL